MTDSSWITVCSFWGKGSFYLPPIKTPCRISLLLTQVFSPISTHPISNLLVILFFKMMSTKEPPCCWHMSFFYYPPPATANTRKTKHWFANSFLRRFLDCPFDLLMDSHCVAQIIPILQIRATLTHTLDSFLSLVFTKTQNLIQRGTYPV